MKKIILSLAALLIIGFLFWRGTQTTFSPEPQSSKTKVVSDSPVKNPSLEAIPKLDSENLNPELLKTLESLPEIEDIQALSAEEVHHTPEIVIEAGKKIGEIMEEAEENPESREEVMNFLVSCSEGENILPSVRALCYRNVLDKVPAWNIFVPVADLKVTKEVQSLSSSIP